MGPRARKAAQELLNKARDGAIKCGHLGIYQKLQKELHAARERLAGREELLQFDTIRQALDAKIEELTAVLQDPSVADHVAICEGVYKLLRACQPLYLALNDGLSVKEACDALDEAEATLDDFADQDAAYKKYRKLNGGWVRDPTGKRVKLNAKAFAKWQAAHERANQNWKQNPYSRTTQTTEKQDEVFVEQKRKDKKRSDKYARRTKKAKTEDDEPTPPNLLMRAMADGTKKYKVMVHLFKFAPAGVRNLFRPREEAMALAARCVANRPAGTARVEQQAARAQKGLPDGVGHYQGGFRAQVIPKKNTYVTLAAPGGGSVFGTAKAAAKAIKDYEDAGSPTAKSHPLVQSVCRV